MLRNALTMSILVVTLFANSVTASSDSPLAELADRGPFHAFAEALGSAETLQSLDFPHGATIFVPTDEAFRRLPESLLEWFGDARGADALHRVIRAHIVTGGSYPSDEVPVEMLPLDDKSRLLATYTDGALTLRLGAPEDTASIAQARASRDSGEARVSEPDIALGKIMVHGIDRVLLPSGLPGSKQQRDGQTAPSAEAGYPAEIAAVDTGPSTPVDISDTPLATPSTEHQGTPVVEQGVVDDLPKPSASTRKGVVVRLDTDPPENRPENRNYNSSTENQQARSGDAAITLVRETVSVANLIGQPVRGTDGAELGLVRDVLVSLEDVSLKHLVYGPADDSSALTMLGITEAETTRVPIGAVAIDPLDGTVIVDRDDG